MAHYYAYCERHGKVGDDHNASNPNAKKMAKADCVAHIDNVPGPHGTVAPKRASSMILPSGKKRYSYKLLKEDEVFASKASKNENPFQKRKIESPFDPAKNDMHTYGKEVICLTDHKGFAMPKNMTPYEIVLDASEGFIPLWKENVTLRWRFNRSSLLYFQNPDAAKNAIRDLLSEAILLWGDAAPVRFKERDDAWDFEIAVRNADNCNAFGCTLASAFFPDSGRHELVLYPKMFTQDKKEQIDTFLHELGHVFGLRHFFADIKESEWPSEIYGKHKPFSIMNYGNKSKLTKHDKSDLRNLYKKVWSGDLKSINGTPIVQVKPYHQLI